MTSGTSLGCPPFGMGNTSIGEKHKRRQTAQIASDARRSRLPDLKKNAHVATRKGNAMNRNARKNQKNVDSKRASPNSGGRHVRALSFIPSCPFWTTLSSLLIVNLKSRQTAEVHTSPKMKVKLAGT